MMSQTIVRAIIFILCVSFMGVVQDAFAEDLVQINSHGRDQNAPFVVYNPEGKRLGKDLRIEDPKHRYKEFPGGYGTETLGCIDCEDPEPVTYVAMFRIFDGEYRVEVLGEGLTTFYVGTGIFTDERGKTFDIEGVVDRENSSVFKFTFNAEDNELWTLSRIATPGSLIADIKLSRKVEWIDNDGIMTSLLRKAEGAADSIERGQAKTAKNQLNALIKEVKAQKRIHIKPDAAVMLIEDAEYLISEL